ncbi:hypothetical protein C8J57DRAFT_1075190 [Mycena rebaudengoi]|nr:hypothetical protein C8J57DRAFT_1075190 [Mycena rebaudengoi]
MPQSRLYCTYLYAYLVSETHFSPLREAPVQHLVEEELVVYDTSFEKDLSPFQIPSSPELDEKWDDLYNFGISRIPKHEAERLPNKTSPDPGFYIAGLNVFHELHCLVRPRCLSALDPDYYPDLNMKTSEPSRKHISHCVDWLRNSIMCHSDTSVIVWQWNAHLNQSTPKARIPHSCKKFQPIQDWGKKNEILADYDHTIHLEDAPICCA